MPIPLIVGAAVMAGSAIYKGVAASKARKEQDRLAKEKIAKGEAMLAEAEANRPEYKVNQGLKQNLSDAVGALNSNLFSTAMNENIDAEGANVRKGIERGANSSAMAMANLASSENNQNKQRREAAITEAQMKDSQRRDVATARTAVANAEDNAWSWNEQNPYLQKVQDARQLIGIGEQQAQEARKMKAQNQQAIGSALGNIGGSVMGFQGLGGK